MVKKPPGLHDDHQLRHRPQKFRQSASKTDKFFAGLGVKLEPSYFMVGGGGGGGEGGGEVFGVGFT